MNTNYLEKKPFSFPPFLQIFFLALDEILIIFAIINFKVFSKVPSKSIKAEKQNSDERREA